MWRHFFGPGWCGGYGPGYAWRAAFDAFLRHWTHPFSGREEELHWLKKQKEWLEFQKKEIEDEIAWVQKRIDELSSSS